MVVPVHSGLPCSPDSPLGSTRFLANLRRFRTRGEQRRAASQQRQQLARQRAVSGHLQGLECIDSITARIEQLAGEFIRESPDFHLARRFFDGRFMVELRGETRVSEDTGRTRRELSRLAFLISLADGESLLLESHLTARDHDLPTERLETPLCDVSSSATGLEAVQEFLDEQFLAFARAFYGAPRGEPESPSSPA